MSEYKLFDSVKLSKTVSLTDGGIAPIGTAGAIVEVLNDGEAYIVELFGCWVKPNTHGEFAPTNPEDSTAFVETIAVETVHAQQICLLRRLPKDLLTVLHDLPEDLLLEVQDFAEFLHQKRSQKSANRERSPSSF